jgi:dipeptide/tripeptide permease
VSQTIDPKTGKLLDSAPTSAAPASVPNTHPPAIYFFFWGEFAERSSYYGMRAILILYLTAALNLPATVASPTYAAFKMGCYSLPLLGGFLADRWIGRYWIIVLFSVPYVLGHYILGIPTIQAMYIALALLAMGSGVTKPNISSLLGETYDQQRPGKERLRSSAFLWFYLAINVGALISQLAMPAIREHHIMSHLSPDAQVEAQKLIDAGNRNEISKHLAPQKLVQEANALAFMFPTILMTVALIVFAAGKRTYAIEKKAKVELTPEQKRQRFYDAVFLVGIFGAFIVYFALDWLIGLKFPEKVDEVFSPANDRMHRILQGAMIAIILPIMLGLIAWSVLSAGKRSFAEEKVEQRSLSPEDKRQRLKNLGYLLAIFGLVILFWFGYEHNDSLWVIFTQDYVNLKLPFNIPVLTISWPPTVARIDSIAPDQLQFINALFVIILIPVFNVMYSVLDPKVRIFTPMRKILVGFILTAAAVGIMSLAGYLVQGHMEEIAGGNATNKVSVYWPAMAYVVLTFGEVLLYGTMLELSYAAAPKSMKGYVTACFLLTNTLANFINLIWTPMYGGALDDPVQKRGPLLPGQFFAITAAVTIAAAIAFIFIGRKFQQGVEATKAMEA